MWDWLKDLAKKYMLAPLTAWATSNFVQPATQALQSGLAGQLDGVAPGLSQAAGLAPGGTPQPPASAPSQPAPEGESFFGSLLDRLKGFFGFGGTPASNTPSQDGSHRGFFGRLFGGLFDMIKSFFGFLLTAVVGLFTGVSSLVTGKQSPGDAVSFAKTVAGATPDGTAPSAVGATTRQDVRTAVTQATTEVKQGIGEIAQGHIRSGAGTMVGGVWHGARDLWNISMNALDGLGKGGAAMKFFMLHEWTREQASGIVASLWQESKLNIRAVGDHGHARGIAQWQEPRQRIIRNATGIDVRNAPFEKQLEAIQWELTQGAATEREAGNMLRRARTAKEAGDIFSRYYERPLRRELEASNRGAMAHRIDTVVSAVVDKHVQAYEVQTAQVIPTSALTTPGQTQQVNAKG